MTLKSSLFFGLILLSVLGCGQGYKSEALGPDGFKEMIEDNPDLQLIDVRTVGEVSSGYIPEAVNIDFRDPGFRQALEKLDRQKPIAVYCAVGQRSQAAYDMLVEMKFHEVYHLTGGTIAWQQKNYSLVKP
ncbi:MAG: rhodanese-like domain-containing protein [Roseivirga sp.]|nr:rhodanese-like domain-containing protein [Roseivirga sp.]